MRHDRTLLCTEVEPQEQGTISLGNVITSWTAVEQGRLAVSGETFPFEPPVLLVSQWAAESVSDRRIFGAAVQMLAPGGEDVLWMDRLQIDLRETTIFRIVYAIPSLRFDGWGLYEFHVFLDSTGPIGEWGRACLIVK